jgi:hypothetical protein
MNHQSFFLRVLPSISLALLLAGCSGGIQTNSETSKGAELKKYKTYAWVKPENPEDEKRKDDKIFSGLILERCNAELQKKGFKLDAENPDAVFLFDTRVEDHVNYTQNAYVSVGVGFGGPGYYGGFAAPVSGGQFVPHETQQGMLFIEMYDTKTQKLLWRGSAQKELKPKSDVESDIKSAIKHIFVRLPVKHKE